MISKKEHHEMLSEHFGVELSSEFPLKWISKEVVPEGDSSRLYLVADINADTLCINTQVWQPMLKDMEGCKGWQFYADFTHYAEFNFPKTN
ncbi:TPA: hypothetical protein ACPVZG_000451 [Vibrio parahaemolyticus]